MNTLRSLLHAALLAAVVALGLAGPALAQQQSDPDNPEANATWQQMRPQFDARLAELGAQIRAALDKGR